MTIIDPKDTGHKTCRSELAMPSFQGVKVLEQTRERHVPTDDMVLSPVSATA